MLRTANELLGEVGSQIAVDDDLQYAGVRYGLVAFSTISEWGLLVGSADSSRRADCSLARYAAGRASGHP